MTESIDFSEQHRRHVVLVANPKAGARSGRPAVERLAGLLRDNGYVAEVVTEIDAASERAEQLLESGDLRTVVAAGGDGTVGLVVNRTPVGTPISILPLGTENLLSKYLHLAPTPESVLRTIQRGNAVRLDAGRVGDRIFLLMASCGFDADVVHRLHGQRRGHIHHLSYAKPILDSIRMYQYPQLRIYCRDGESSPPNDERSTSDASPREPILARWAFVMNLPRYAGGLQIIPQALGDDGLLDVCTFREGSLWTGLMYLAGVLFGRHQNYQDCVNRRASRIRIESDIPAPYQLDGDPGGFTPLEIETLPGRLTLLAPPSSSPVATPRATETPA
ncbi:MAG: diacylglycerol kinase family lipid kinase [Pirellulaceae bacterium]